MRRRMVDCLTPDLDIQKILKSSKFDNLNKLYIHGTIHLKLIDSLHWIEYNSSQLMSNWNVSIRQKLDFFDMKKKLFHGSIFSSVALLEAL